MGKHSLISTLVAPEVTKYTVASFFFVLTVPRMYGVYKYSYMDKSVGSYVKFRYSEKATKF